MSSRFFRLQTTRANNSPILEENKVEVQMRGYSREVDRENFKIGFYNSYEKV